MKRGHILTAVFLVFPRLRLVKTLVVSFKSSKMQLPVKIAIGSGVTFFVILIFGFIAFPKLIKHKIKTNLQLKPNSDIRKLWSKVPFAIDFKIYIFNVTNPNDVLNGDSPVVDEIGPYYFEEWKEKADLVDNEAEDSVTYFNKFTWVFDKSKSHGLTGDEIITIPHPMMVGMAVAVARDKPAMLNLINKAINSIFRNPTTPFLTARVMDILFDGVVINCTGTDFAGTAVCKQLRESKDLHHITDDIMKFSFFGVKNGTVDTKPLKVLRGIKNSHDLGRVIAYDNKTEMDVWPTKECNQYVGTDSTIFPPFLTPEEGIASFAPDLCRSLIATYDKDVDFRGVTIKRYIATLGDMSKDPALKCFCPKPDKCYKQGVYDLTKCVGAPIVVSQPHFYDADEMYQKGVRGLHPDEKEHGIELVFETMTGTPVAGYKRLQFNLPLEKIEKIPMMQNMPNTLVPLFWVEEGAELPKEYADQLVGVFKTFKIIKIVKWVLLLASLAGLGGAGFLHYKKKDAFTVTPVHEVKPASVADSETKKTSVISMVNTAGNEQRNGREFDRY